MTKDLNDHSNITKLLQIQKKEYFTFNPAPGVVARFVLKGLSPNATCEEIADELKSSGIKVSHDQETRKKTHPIGSVDNNSRESNGKHCKSQSSH